MTRVFVFIDYQNVYHRARGAFDLESAAPWMGHIRPVRLAHLVTTMGRGGDPTRQLIGVNVYRGEPVAGRCHPTLQAAYQRQTAKWKNDDPDLLSLRSRPLRYDVKSWDARGRPNGWGAAREKGIDVMLALDLALGAQSDAFDVAIVVSGDTDLLPAIEAAFDFNKRVENAVWWPPHEPGRPLRRSGGKSMWCHRLTDTHFASVLDDTDYSSA